MRTVLLSGILAAGLIAGCSGSSPSAAPPSGSAPTASSAPATVAPAASVEPTAAATPASTSVATPRPTPAPTPPPAPIFDTNQLVKDMKSGAVKKQYPDASEAKFERALAALKEAHPDFVKAYVAGADDMEVLRGNKMVTRRMSWPDRCRALIFDPENEAKYHTAELTWGCSNLMGYAVNAANRFRDRTSITLAKVAMGMVFHGYLSNEQEVRDFYADEMNRLARENLP